MNYLFLAMTMLFSVSFADAETSCYALSVADQAKTKAPHPICLTEDAIDFSHGSLKGSVTTSGLTFPAVRILAGEDIYLISGIFFKDDETTISFQLYATEDNHIEGEPEFVLEFY